MTFSVALNFIPYMPDTDTLQSQMAYEALHDKRILLALSGGIACYKAAELCRLLVKAQAQVHVAMTQSALQFITPITMQALSNHAVFTDLWDNRPHHNMAHIELTRQCDAIVIAPASANTLSKLAHGAADDLLSLLCLAKPPHMPLIMAPAMNREMYAHPATQRNIAQLKADGVHICPVGQGEQACGEMGEGRMLEPYEIMQEIACALSPQVLSGRRVVITAGPTFEAIDPVRGITNKSSGKMGFAIAHAARQAGARVTLIAGPVAMHTPLGVMRIDVTSAQQMHEATLQHTSDADIFIATAAVADWRIKEISQQKIKKNSSGAVPSLEFVLNPDILAHIAQSPRAQSGALYCVGFAAESEHLEKNSQSKRLQKNVPLLVGNIGHETFGQDDNALLLVEENQSTHLERSSKAKLAKQLIEFIAERATY